MRTYLRLRDKLLLLAIVCFAFTIPMQAQTASWDYDVVSPTVNTPDTTGSSKPEFSGSFDSGRSLVKLPFAFDFYSDTYQANDTIWVSTNGNLRFDDEMSKYSQGSSSIPTSSSTYGAMIQYGGTGDGKFTADLKTRVIGTAPNREFVIYIPYASYYGTWEAEIFVSLFETTNEIKVQYENVVSGTSYKPLHIGINAGDGVFGEDLGDFPSADIAYSFTVPSLPADNSGITELFFDNNTTGNIVISARIKNFGTSALSTATLNWSVDGAVQTNGSYTGSLAQNSTDSITIGTFNFATAKDYDVCVWTSNPNGNTDGDTSNDSVCVTTRIYGPLTFPLAVGFEGNLSEFDNASGNDVDFVENTTLFAEGTKSVLNAHTSSNANVLFQTAGLDLTSTTAPVLEFKHIAKTEGTYDKCYVQISVDGGNTYETLDDSLYFGASRNFASKGYFHEDSYTEWGTDGTTTLSNAMFRTERYDLSDFKQADVRIRFRLTSDGSANREGWYIDDLEIKENYADDAGIDAIYATDTQGNLPVSVSLKNYGIDLSSATINWSVDDVAQAPFTLASTVAAFATDSITIGTFNFDTAKDYEIKVWTSAPNGNTDANTFNDTLVKTFTVMKAIDAGANQILVAQILPGTGDVNVEVKNYGTTDLTSATIQWSVNGTAQTAFAYTGNVVKDDVDTALVGTYNFATSGDYVIKAWVELTGDEDDQNDTTEITVTIANTVTLDYDEDFESQTADDFIVTVGSQAALTIDDDEASQGTYSAHFTGGTSSSFTGSGSTSATSYTWTNTNQRATAQLIVDAQSAPIAIMEFDLKQTYTYGAGYSNFRVLVNGTPITSSAGVTNHRPSTKSSDNFSRISYDLSAYAGTVFTLEFQSECKYESASSSSDAVFVDSLTIFVPTTEDVQVLSLMTPENGPCVPASTTVQAIVKNLSASTQTALPFTMWVTGANTETLTTTVTLAPGQLDTIEFVNVATPAAGVYNVKVFTNIAGDIDNTNDTLTGSFEFFAPLTIPYSQNFEGTMDEWDLDGFGSKSDHGLTSTAISENMWNAGSSRPTAYTKGKFNAVSANDHLSFDYRFVLYATGNAAYNLAQDSLIVWVSNDCGASFAKLYVIDSTNHVNTDQMARVNIPLAAYAGDDIIVGLEGVWDAVEDEDYWLDIDSIEIKEMLIVDLGPDATVCSNDSLELVGGIVASNTYEWKDLAGTTLATTPSLWVNTAGTYIVNVSTPSGLSDADTVAITVNTVAPVSFTGLSAEYCETEASVTLVPTPAGGVFTGNGITGSDFDPATAGAGAHTITYTYTDANNCVETDVQNVTVGASFDAVASDDMVICAGESANLNVNATVLTNDLFFTEYIEGSSNNKALEIYNGTGSTVFLDNYAFPSVGNSPTTPGEYEYWNTFTTGDSIPNGEVYVIAHAQADAAILAVADMTHQYLSNGDDGYALAKNDGTWDDLDNDGVVDAGEMTGYTVLDRIGNFDADPGSGWDVAGVVNGTKDHTLVRKMHIKSGNNDWTAAAGTDSISSEWLVYPKDTMMYIGSHNMLPAGITYAWSNGVNTQSQVVTPNATTEYYVTVTDICEAKDTVVVTVNALPAVSITAPDTICVNHELTLDAGTGFVTYEWNDNSTASSLVVAANTLAVGTHNYSVTVSDANGCEGTDAVDVYVDPCTGINELNDELNYVIYPNPTSGMLNIEFEAVTIDASVSVINAAGQIVQRMEVRNEDHIQLDLTAMAKGVYYIRLVSDNKTLIEKIIVD